MLQASICAWRTFKVNQRVAGSTPALAPDAQIESQVRSAMLDQNVGDKSSARSSVSRVLVRMSLFYFQHVPEITRLFVVTRQKDSGAVPYWVSEGMLGHLLQHLRILDTRK